MNTARFLTVSLALTALAGCPLIPSSTNDDTIKDSFLKWNRVAIDASGLDHTAVAVGEDRVFGHQLGPTRSSRAMAIVHIAMMDAVIAIEGGYESYTRTAAVTEATSVQAAIAQAAHDTLVAMFPSHSENFDAALAEDLAEVADGRAEDNGVSLGQQVAAAILAMRTGDGADVTETYVFSDMPGKWRKDPINPTQQPLGEEWHNVKPFALNSAAQFRAPEPPSIESTEYAEAFNEVKELGGDGITTPTSRTEDQTETGIYWAYDGTPSLCAPPRLYNQIASQLGVEQGLSGIELARLLTLVNVSMADAGIACWDSKYYYNYWRPVTGIREADAGTGPTGLGDNNPDTEGDVSYVPLCAPASNLSAPNFTPPFPAYPSGHATFGGALFETLRETLGGDDIAFTFVSDEYNGATVDHEGNIRPLKPRSFTSLSQAEEENGQSRIYLGIHWSFDKTSGITMGNEVADHVLSTIYRPVP